jgi:prenyltransferase beta subunit
MRISFALVLVLPSFACAQSEETVRAVERKLADARTAKWVLECEAGGGGFCHAPPKGDAKPQPSLRATNGAVRALKYLGFPLLKSERETHAKFVLSCYDPKTGAFAEPGGKPDVTITSIGVMVAAELEIPHDKYAKAMDYLKENAKTFEEVRIGAAAVEAWGVSECPFKLDEWVKIADAERASWKAPADPKGPNGHARALGSYQAFRLRLGLRPNIDAASEPWLGDTQWADGGWGKKGEKASDMETTYRVMRALMLLKESPKDGKKLRAFIESHRNADGGYATKPGEASSMSGVYYYAIVSKWLDDMEKK